MRLQIPQFQKFSTSKNRYPKRKKSVKILIRNADSPIRVRLCLLHCLRGCWKVQLDCLLARQSTAVSSPSSVHKMISSDSYCSELEVFTCFHTTVLVAFVISVALKSVSLTSDCRLF